MKTEHYDIVVIWAWAGGLTASIWLSKVWKKVALIEKWPMWGDCTNFWCVPSKALIHYWMEKPELWIKKALELVREKRQHFLDEESWEQMKEKFWIDVFAWRGTFKNKNTIIIDDHTEITFKKAIISTWSHARTIEIEWIPKDKLLTNEEIFEIDTEIKNLVVVGWWYIWCELGEAFAHLWVNVTLLNRWDRLIKNEEPEASQVIHDQLVKAWVTILYNTTITRGSGKDLLLDIDWKEHTVPYDYALLSIWRISTTKWIWLDNAWIKFSNKWIEVNKYNVTSNKNVFAVGDCVAENPKFTHWADHEARWVVRNILVPWFKKSVRNQTLPMSMYTTTEVSRIWMTKQELVKAWLDDDSVTITEYFNNDDRSFLNDEQQWFVKIHFSRIRGKILWATIVSPKAWTMLPLLTQAKDEWLSAYKIMSTVHAYPTKGRVIKKVAQGFVVETLTNFKREIWYWLKLNMFKLFALFLWTTVGLIYMRYKKTYGVSNADIWRSLYDFVTWTTRWPLLYILIYAIRPVILFPASILTLLSWVIFWPIRWVIYTIFWENASANFAYYIWSKLWKGIIKPWSQWVFANVKERLSWNEFMSVLMLRIIPLPFDLVNYACGILQVTWKKYALWTLLWIMPWLVTFVLFWASIENIQTFNFNEISLNWSYLTLAIVLYAVSIWLAVFFKKRMKQ